MWHQNSQKFFILICFTVSIYLSKLNVDASAVKGSYEPKGEEIFLNVVSATNKFKCPSLFGSFPDTEDCSRFYLCVAGISKNFPCPKFTQFDKYKKKCVSSFIAICDKGKGKKTTVADKKVTKDPSFLCPSMIGSFPHPTDCSRYYACTFFIPIQKTCPERELFDGIKKECRPENEVECGARNRPTGGTTPMTTPLLPKSSTPVSTTPEASSPNPTTPEPTTRKPTTQEIITREPTTPEESTVTEEVTTEFEQTAPETTCDEDDIDCIITETGELPEWFKCPVELGSHRHPLSKKLFIFCINWKPHVKRCGQDLIFSKELETCVSP